MKKNKPDTHLRNTLQLLLLVSAAALPLHLQARLPEKQTDSYNTVQTTAQPQTAAPNDTPRKAGTQTSFPETTAPQQAYPIAGNTEAAAPQAPDTLLRQPNIDASKYIIPKRRPAEKFESRKGVEHLFFSAGAGMEHLLDMGSGRSLSGPAAVLYAGNWFTPVIGIRGGLHYAMWKEGSVHTNLIGVRADYLLNLSAFAARYNPRRLFEVIGAIGIGYRAAITSGAQTTHTYGLRAGLQGKFNVSPALNLFIEPGLALYPDRVDNAYSWRRYDLAASWLVGITYKPSGFSQTQLLQNGFASLGIGTGNTGNLLFNTEFALGKWFDNVNGVRISAGSSTAFIDNDDTILAGDAAGADRDFNINLCADYLCNLTTLLSGQTGHRFDLLFAGGIGSYFPGAESSAAVIVNGRFGFQGLIWVSEHAGVWIEPRVTVYKDREYRPDLQHPIRGSVGIMIGTSYRF